MAKIARPGRLTPVAAQRTLVQAARRLVSLQRRAARLRRELKDVESEVRQARRELKALASCVAEPLDTGALPLPPLKVFGEQAS